LVKEFEEEYYEIERVRKRRNDKEDRKGKLLWTSSGTTIIISYGLIPSG